MPHPQSGHDRGLERGYRKHQPAWIGVEADEEADSAIESMHDEPQGID